MIREGDMLLLLFLKDRFTNKVWNCFLDWDVNQNKQRNILLADSDGT